MRYCVSMRRLFESPSIMSLKRDYGSVISSIDPMTVLDHYGAERVSEDQTEWIKHSCLIDRVVPHHEHGDANPSAALNKRNLGYSCFSFVDDRGKSGGDIWWFLNLMEDGDEKRIRDVILKLYDPQVLDRKITFHQQVLDSLQKSRERNKPYRKQITSFSPEAVSRFATYHPYLESRGVSRIVAERYLLGWDDRAKKIVLPHWHEGKLVGWQKRVQTDPRWEMTPKEDREPKFKMSTDFPSNDTLWNLDTVKERGCKSVVLVESVFSVLRAETYNELPEYSGKFNNFVSTFSARLSQEQLELLDDFEEVVLFFDSDMAGVKAAIQAFHLTKPMHRVQWILIPEYKDFDEIPDPAQALSLMKANTYPGPLGLIVAQEAIL